MQPNFRKPHERLEKMKKTCKQCGKQLKRRDNELEVHWTSRQFCNRSCATKYQWEQKKK